MARIFYADGTVKEVEPKNGTDFSLEEMRTIVGGYIEITHTVDDGEIMVVNEEGKLCGLPLNINATRLHRYNDEIVGNVLVCRNDEVK